MFREYRHVIILQILCFYFKKVFAKPLVEKIQKSCDACTSSLYYCKKIDGEGGGNNFICEMDTTILKIVIILAIITGIILPIGCISLYVCGFYSKIINYLTSSVKRGEDASLLERDYRRGGGVGCDGDTLPSISMPSVDSLRPIERKFKKNPNRFSQPQCELLSNLGRRSASTDM